VGQHPSAYTHFLAFEAYKEKKQSSDTLSLCLSSAFSLFPNVSSHVLIPINEHIPFDSLNNIFFGIVLYYFLVGDDVYVSRYVVRNILVWGGFEDS